MCINGSLIIYIYIYNDDPLRMLRGTKQPFHCDAAPNSLNALPMTGDSFIMSKIPFHSIIHRTVCLLSVIRSVAYDTEQIFRCIPLPTTSHNRPHQGRSPKTRLALYEFALWALQLSSNSLRRKYLSIQKCWNYGVWRRRRGDSHRSLG